MTQSIQSLYCFRYCKLFPQELTCGPEVNDTKSFIQNYDSLSEFQQSTSLLHHHCPLSSQQYRMVTHLYFPLQSSSANNKNVTCTQEYTNLCKFPCISLVVNPFTIGILSEHLPLLCQDFASYCKTNYSVITILKPFS